MAAGQYTIKITPASGTSVEVKALNAAATITYNEQNHNTGLGKELEDSIPSWYKTNTKSQKWGDAGKPAAISATVTVGKDGGTSVTYNENKFDNYMKTGSEASK